LFDYTALDRRSPRNILYGGNFLKKPQPTSNLEPLNLPTPRTPSPGSRNGLRLIVSPKLHRRALKRSKKQILNLLNLLRATLLSLHSKLKQSPGFTTVSFLSFIFSVVIPIRGTNNGQIQTNPQRKSKKYVPCGNFLQTNLKFKMSNCKLLKKTDFYCFQYLMAVINKNAKILKNPDCLQTKAELPSI